MKVYQSIQDIKPIKRPVVTLGMFDGAHIGHQSILKQLNTIAQNIDGESVLITFNPHPRMVLQPNCDLKFLNTLQEKEEILRQFELEHLIIQEFTKDFSQVTSVEFVKNLLVDKIKIDTLVIGYDHHFGKNREGNFEQLQVLSKEFGFNLIQLEAIEENDVAVSSTKIRNALNEGNIEYANKALNYNYPLSGKVVHGDKIGRTLGFPTANLEVDPNKLIPKDGVYAVDVFVDDTKHLGLLSIGFRETVTNSREHRVEVNILNFDQDIYGKTIKLEFLGRLRDEKKFNSLDELISAMNQDKENAITRFG
ncbi:riboflavin kinase / FMN adenylyltransferase [Algoriella xinjiangensis]|uniref:Riboflavin biosynthesis protein n=1 Tax=Algoriella xinjiangensis TaxID=684065 RepID=A0A1I4YEF5_9FLAO|nr:bifunctional riboflavin kinase/FAD synthetase [Algoriella xinjiangensis]SFN36153.1 riboflavin kinase / FMN adenylyltransferase [Algoriella xinjiangensis]VDH17292.1 Riboflavin biosynthesis protein ribF [Algoriella xinjiangensis]